MDLRTKVISALRWSAIGRIIGQAVSWASTIIVIRLLTPEDYALIALSSLVIGFSEILREVGLGAAIIQQDNLDDEQLRSIFGVTILVHLFLFICVYFSAPAVAFFFDEEKLVDIIRVSSLQLMILMFLVIPSAKMYRAMRFKWISMLQTTSMVMASLVTLSMAYQGFGVWSLVGGQFVGTLIHTIGFFIGQPFCAWPSFQFQKIRSLISYSGHIFSSEIIYYFYTRADVGVIGKSLGETALGYYTIAYNLATLPMNKISGMLSTVGFPAYSLLKNNIPEVKSKFLFTIEANSLVFFPVLWGLSCVADDFVSVFLGEKWLPSIIVLQLITLIAPLQMTGPLVRPALLGIGRADLSFANLVTNAICVLSAIIIGSFWGLVGVCVGWIVGFSLAYYINLRRFLPVLNTHFREFGKTIALSAFMAFVMYLVVKGMQVTALETIDPVYRLCFSVVIGAMVYGGLGVMLNPGAFIRIKNLIKG